MAVAISLCVPVLVGVNLQALLAFFTDKLGFVVQFKHGEPLIYAGVERDHAELHLATTGLRPTPNRNTWKKFNEPADVRFFVPDIDALYQEFISRGVSIAGPPQTQSYGIRDFDVLTPDGHTLRFNQVLSHRSA